MNEENLNELKEVLKEVSKDEEYEEYVFFDEMEKIKIILINILYCAIY